MVLVHVTAFDDLNQQISRLLIFGILTKNGFSNVPWRLRVTINMNGAAMF
jgi:hypothetical protein